MISRAKVQVLPDTFDNLLLASSAMSVELFQYRGAAKDGGKLEYAFEAAE